METTINSDFFTVQRLSRKLLKVTIVLRQHHFTVKIAKGTSRFHGKYPQLFLNYRKTIPDIRWGNAWTSVD